MAILIRCIQFCMFVIDINWFYIVLFLLITGYFSRNKSPRNKPKLGFLVVTYSWRHMSILDIANHLEISMNVQGITKLRPGVASNWLRWNWARYFVDMHLMHPCHRHFCFCYILGSRSVLCVWPVNNLPSSVVCSIVEISVVGNSLGLLTVKNFGLLNS